MRTPWDTPAVSEEARRWVRTIETHHHLQVTDCSRLAGGEETGVFLLTTVAGAKVMRVSPRWRLVEELDWSYSLSIGARQMVGEVIAPQPTDSGQLLVREGAFPISIWPYVPGAVLDRRIESQRDAAAALMGRLHRGLHGYSDLFAPRPGNPNAPNARPSEREPKEIADDHLDRWLSDNRDTFRLPGLLHGDFWHNNLIWDGSRIAGLLDWDDARHGNIYREIASSVWEFCEDPLTLQLDLVSADRFLDVYYEAGGIAPLEDRSFLMPLVRDYLRAQVRYIVNNKDELSIETEHFQNLITSFLKTGSQNPY